MWNKIRDNVRAEWQVVLGALLAANLIFIVLLQMQRAEYYGQQVAMMNAMQGASTGLIKREEDRNAHLSEIQRLLERFTSQLGDRQELALMQASHKMMDYIIKQNIETQTAAGAQITAISATQKMIDHVIDQNDQLQRRIEQKAKQ